VRHERLSILPNIVKRGGCRLTVNIYGNGHEIIPEPPPIIQWAILFNATRGVFRLWDKN
jgi:hypothetical protein